MSLMCFKNQNLATEVTENTDGVRWLFLCGLCDLCGKGISA